MSKVNLSKKDKKEELSHEIEEELSQVATNPKQNILILAIISLVFLYLFLNLFIDNETNEIEKEVDLIPAEVVTPIKADKKSNVSSIPELPSIALEEKLETQLPPPPPPKPKPQSEFKAEPATSKENSKDIKQVTLPQEELQLPTSNNMNEVFEAPSALPFNQIEEEDRKRKEAGRKSPLLLFDNDQTEKTPDQLQEEIDFKRLDNLDLTLTRGKIINAVVETAINTDFSNEVRAVVNRDVYAEYGQNILIPKGSRILGNYSVDVDATYGYVEIEWTRVSLPNGYILNLSSTAVDHLGRKGHQGRLDKKIKERISGAILRSSFNVAFAYGLDKVSPLEPKNAEASSNNSQVATSIRDIATKTFIETGLTDQAKITQICNQTKLAISDQTSTTYQQINNACNGLPTSGLSDDLQLKSLIDTVNRASDELVKTNNSESQKSHMQEATQQAYSDVSDSIKEIVQEQKLNPNITINPGTIIKVYVNKDYVFPKTAVDNR